MSSQLLEVVERMDGDIYNRRSMTVDECIEQLTSLSYREFCCGAFWMFKTLYPKSINIQAKLALAKTKDEMLEILDIEELIS